MTSSRKATSIYIAAQFRVNKPHTTGTAAGLLQRAAACYPAQLAKASADEDTQ
jgi:hypothetical protein